MRPQARAPRASCGGGKRGGVSLAPARMPPALAREREGERAGRASARAARAGAAVAAWRTAGGELRGVAAAGNTLAEARRGGGGGRAWIPDEARARSLAAAPKGSPLLVLANDGSVYAVAASDSRDVQQMRAAGTHERAAVANAAAIDGDSDARHPHKRQRRVAVTASSAAGAGAAAGDCRKAVGACGDNAAEVTEVCCRTPSPAPRAGADADDGAMPCAEGRTMCLRAVARVPSARCMVVDARGRAFVATLGCAVQEVSLGTPARAAAPRTSQPFDALGARAPTRIIAVARGGDGAASSPLGEMLCSEWRRRRLEEPQGGVVLVLGDACGELSAHSPPCGMSLPAGCGPAPLRLASLEQPITVLEAVALVASGGGAHDALVAVGSGGRAALLIAGTSGASPKAYEWALHCPVEGGTVAGAGERTRLLLLSRGALLVCRLRETPGDAGGAGGAFCPAVRLDPQPVVGFPSALAVCTCAREDVRAEGGSALADDTVCILRGDGELFLSPLQSLQPSAEEREDVDDARAVPLAPCARRPHRSPESVIDDIERLECAVEAAASARASTDSALAEANCALHAAAALAGVNGGERERLLPADVSLRLAMHCGAPVADAVRVRLTNALDVPLGAACRLLIELRQGAVSHAESAPIGPGGLPAGGAWESDVCVRAPLDALLPVRVDITLCVRAHGARADVATTSPAVAASAERALFRVWSGRVDVIDCAQALAVHAATKPAVAEDSALSGGVLGGGATSGAAAHAGYAAHSTVTPLSVARARKLEGCVTVGSWRVARRTDATERAMARSRLAVSRPAAFSLAVERRGGAWAAITTSDSLMLTAAAHEAVTWRLDALGGAVSVANCAKRACSPFFCSRAHPFALALTLDAMICHPGHPPTCARNFCRTRLHAMHPVRVPLVPRHWRSSTRWMA